jgi:hypothetical protein
MRLNDAPAAFTQNDDGEFLHQLVDTHVSIFSKTMETGVRVSLNTHAPLRLPGMLSTAGHCDQSRLAIVCAPFSDYRDSGKYGY